MDQLKLNYYYIGWFKSCLFIKRVISFENNLMQWQIVQKFVTPYHLPQNVERKNKTQMQL